MEQQQQLPLEQTLAALAETRKRLQDIEAEWKVERARSKQLTLSLILDHGYSLFKAHQISGHNRQTVKVWVEASKPGSQG